MRAKKLTDQAVIAYLKGECDHFVNKACTTRGCFIRGGWDGKTVPIDVEPTCEYRRAVELINLPAPPEMPDE